MGDRRVGAGDAPLYPPGAGGDRARRTPGCSGPPTRPTCPTPRSMRLCNLGRAAAARLHGVLLPAEDRRWERRARPGRGRRSRLSADRGPPAGGSATPRWAASRTTSATCSRRARLAARNDDLRHRQPGCPHPDVRSTRPNWTRSRTTGSGVSIADRLDPGAHDVPVLPDGVSRPAGSTACSCAVELNDLMHEFLPEGFREEDLAFRPRALSGTRPVAPTWS